MAALQMTWQTSLLIQKRHSGPPLGLRNLGNTCYLNSVLQCLTYTPPLAQFCLNFQHSSNCDSATEKKSECPFCILERRIARSLSIDSNLDAPLKINNCLKIFAEHFRFGRQEDAHEFLRYVIDACHDACLRLKKLQQQQRKKGGGNGGDGEDSTVLKEIFGGALQNQVKCLSCGAESNKVDEIMDISLDVMQNGSVKEALNKFFQPEVLDGNNKYNCDNCKKLVAARKQMSILQAPNVLVIQLKRFDGIFGGKIDKVIAFEEVLVLSSYICKASQDPHPEYKLFGTIVHSGFSPDSGHYYAYIKDAMDRWYCCNDSYVSLSTLQEVLSEKAYILFFSRSKQRSAPANTALASNGVKTRDCNHHQTSKSSTTGRPVKIADIKQSVAYLSNKDNPIASKVAKMPSNTKILSGSANGNVKIILHKRESNGKNGNVKASVSTEKSEKNMTSVIGRNVVSKSKSVYSEKRQALPLAKGNGVTKNKLVDAFDSEKSQELPLANGIGVAKNKLVNAVDREKSQELPFANCNGDAKNKSVNTVDSEKSQAFPLVNGNGNLHNMSDNSLEADRHEDNGLRSHVVTESEGRHQELQNGNGNCPSDISGSKRKVHDKNSCILFSKDADSQAKLEELKEALGKEAHLVLQSYGWSDKVVSFMSSRKKLCARGALNGASKSEETKRLLIADAKRTFISQIPESLKENLIERLRSFSQEKY